MEQTCYIYKITCIPENKCYIGQTQKYKYKDGKPYNYGIAGRLCDHASTSKRSDTPLCVAIREHGISSFKIECLETVLSLTADEREAYWINLSDTRVPNGYNVMSHSRCKHRDGTSIGQVYLDTAESVELKIINKGGNPHLVYVYLTTPTERKRFTFGQSKTSSFEDAMLEARAFVKPFEDAGVKVIDREALPFDGEVLSKVRLVTFNKTMVAVYLKTKNNDQKRICFGGKTVKYEDAIQKARNFISRLSFDVLEDTLLKSWQQAATGSVEANPELEK
jgi:group I intron endonuclease